MKFQLPDFESKLQGIIDISKKNSLFNAMSDVDQRREVAYDALLLIKRDVLIASSGCYWSYDLQTYLEEGMSLLNAQSSSYLCKKLHTLPSECKVCGRGALMISILRLGNDHCYSDNKEDISLSQVSKGTHKTIKGFTSPNFRAVEEEYEEDLYRHPYLRNSEEKLANIMFNIIFNGFFNIYDRTDYLN